MTSLNEILHKASLNRLEIHSQLCLYGDPSLSNSDNTKVILSTLKDKRKLDVSQSPHPPHPPTHQLVTFFFGLCIPCFSLWMRLFYLTFDFYIRVICSKFLRLAVVMAKFLCHLQAIVNYFAGKKIP